MTLVRRHAAGLFVLLILGACSGEDFTSGEGGSGASGGNTGTGGGNGGSGGALPSICPAQIPTAGDLCDQEALLCTYGNDARPSCRTHSECNGGKWATTKQPNCDLAVPCELTRVTGSVCLIKSEECVSPDHFCACVCNPGCSTYKWVCPSPGPGCPAIAPNAGTGCSPSGTNCVYGVCDDMSPVRDQVRIECKDGAWEWTDRSCLS
jgi:hypothetical protein